MSSHFFKHLFNQPCNLIFFISPLLSKSPTFQIHNSATPIFFFSLPFSFLTYFKSTIQPTPSFFSLSPSVSLIIQIHNFVSTPSFFLYRFISTTWQHHLFFLVFPLISYLISNPQFRQTKLFFIIHYFFHSFFH